MRASSHQGAEDTVSVDEPGRRASAPYVERYRRWTEPTADGLPRARVLFSFPLLLLVLGAILIGVGVNGTSSGAFFDDVSAGNDPNLVAGAPREIRTDEWNVQTVWAIAQIEQGLPEVNETFPGGMDTTLPQDLPRIDWSVSLRPHLWGFALLPADNAFAWKWWIPGLAVLAAAFMFVVTLLPRRPLVAAMLAVAFFYSPLLQWWYLSTTLWPIAWGFVTVTAVVWAVRSGSRRSRWLWAAVVGYLTAVTATGIYAPFIIPVALIAVAFAGGTIVAELRDGRGLGNTLRRAVPLLIAGAAAGAVVGFWLWQKRTVVSAFLGTAYPGDRSTPAGGGDITSFASAIGSSFTGALNSGQMGILGPNMSEASTFFVVGVFLIPVVVWIAVREVRNGRRLPWLLLAVSAMTLVLIAFIFIPGWDPVARLLLLDKTIHARVRIGVGFGSFILLALVLRYLDEHRVRAGILLAAIPAGLYLLSQVGVAVLASRRTPEVVSGAPLWWLWAVLGAAVIFWAARNRAVLASLTFVVIAVAGSLPVNPVYIGVLDLRDTSLSKQIQEIDDSAGGTWVGVGSGVTTAMLLESGVTAYNGFQGAPSEAFWGKIDPTGSHEFEWNRLAGISWTPGEGEPVPTNPAGDQISLNFDACSTFAQDNVEWVLSDSADIDTTCLDEVSTYSMPLGEYTIYKVTRG